MGSIADKLKGTAKQIEGKLTGDKARTAQGTVQKAKGAVEGVAERAARKVRAGVARARLRVRSSRG